MDNIMVVIYASLIRLPIIKHLAGEGNSVFPVTDVSSALKKMADGSVNCVILDLNFPSIVNGLYLLKKMRKDYPDVEIIIINSNLDEKAITILSKVGIKHIMNTPVNLEELSNIINSISG